MSALEREKVTEGFNSTKEPEGSALEVLHPKDERKVRLLRPLFEFVRSVAFLNPGNKCLGGENLSIAQELLFQGNKLIVTPNHLSHIDHFFLWAFIDRESQKMNLRDFFGQFVFIGRESLYEEAHFQKILPLADIIGVVSPPELEKLVKRRDREEIRLARARNEAANAKFGECLENGKIGVVYVEGQRSPNGKLMEINPHVATPLRKGDYIMPVSFVGTEYVLPREWQEKFDQGLAAVIDALTGNNKLKALPQLPGLLGELFKTLPSPFAPVTFTIGEPYAVDKELSDKELSRVAGQKIAEILPPQYRGFYGGVV